MLRFGHRGASALAPENTLAAFRKAAELHCDWIETDVRLTGDGVPVLLHDARVERTTGIRGEVGRMPLGRVLRLDAGSWFGREFRGERIPTLDEALEWSRGRCQLNLEVKEEERTAEAIRQIARRLTDHDALDRVLLSSFRAPDLVRIRSITPWRRATSSRYAWISAWGAYRRDQRGLGSKENS